MLKRIAFGIMLTTLLVSTLTFAFSFIIVGADEFQRMKPNGAVGVSKAQTVDWHRTDEGVSSVNSLTDTWPMFRHDPKHTGRSPYFAAPQASLKWTYATGDSIYQSSPAIAPDGTIYVGSNDHNIYAINPDGTLKWNYTTGDTIYSSPAIGSDGTIYIGSMWADRKVYAINPDGTLKWSYTTISDVSSSPAIDPSSGVIYVAASYDPSWNGRMYAFYPNGTLVDGWPYNPSTGSSWITASAAIREDGVILFGDFTNPRGVFRAISPDGTVLWQRTIPCPYGEIDIFSSAAIDSDGMIYFGGGHRNRHLWALYSNSTIAWSYLTGDEVESSPAIAEDGTIYVGSYDDKLYAINKNGALKWAYITGGNIHSSPAIGADGTIYVGSNDHNIYAINPDGTLKWNYTTGGAVNSSPAIGSDGTVYVGSCDGKLYAFERIYNVTVQAYCCSESTPKSVNITMDGSPTGYNTPHTFTGLTGTPNITVPSADLDSHPFNQWGNGETDTTITITSDGTYTAYYGIAYSLTITTTIGGTTNPSPGTQIYCTGTMVNVTAIPDSGFYIDHWELDGFNVGSQNPIIVTMNSDHTLHVVFRYNVTIEAYCLTEGEDVNVSIYMDGSPTNHTTLHTFTGLTGTHVFAVPITDLHGCPFIQWSTGETDPTVIVTTGGTYTAYYETFVHDVAVTNVTLSKTVVGQGYCVNISVTVENPGDFLEWFGIVVPCFGGEVIPTPEQWETFWSMGDVDRNGYINVIDSNIIALNVGWEGPPGENPADINSDGIVDLFDALECAYNTAPERSVIWTYFELPLPPKGTQRGTRLHPDNQITLTFTWNTTEQAMGNYSIIAYAEPVTGETSTIDNTFIVDSELCITIQGDIDADRDVDIFDIVKMAGAYGSSEGEDSFDPNCDLDGDGDIDIFDIVIACGHYGESW